MYIDLTDLNKRKHNRNFDIKTLAPKISQTKKVPGFLVCSKCYPHCNVPRIFISIIRNFVPRNVNNSSQQAT